MHPEPPEPSKVTGKVAGVEYVKLGPDEVAFPEAEHDAPAGRVAPAAVVQQMA